MEDKYRQFSQHFDKYCSRFKSTLEQLGLIVLCVGAGMVLNGIDSGQQLL